VKSPIRADGSSTAPERGCILIAMKTDSLAGQHSVKVCDHTFWHDITDSYDAGTHNAAARLVSA
jgi:hypothetical protein